jgi:hypothetical protein
MLLIKIVLPGTTINCTIFYVTQNYNCRHRFLHRPPTNQPTMTVTPYNHHPFTFPLVPSNSLPLLRLSQQQQQQQQQQGVEQGQEGQGGGGGGGYTVQDYPHLTPVYNGVNPNYPNLQVLHQNPPIFCIPDFLSPTECDFLICIAQDCFSPAPVVGKGAGEVSASRTSSTCYLAREDLPLYLHKVSLLTGKPVEHCELPQVGRYFPSQQYLQHFDAFDLSNEDGRRFACNGGQRTVTVLVYLNHVERGGETAFPALNLEIRPQKGMALVFFPATVDGLLDKNVLHAAKPAIDTKYVSQVWIRQGNYDGIPSKRIFSSVEQASIVQKSLVCARGDGNGEVDAAGLLFGGGGNGRNVAFIGGGDGPTKDRGAGIAVEDGNSSSSALGGKESYMNERRLNR